MLEYAPMLHVSYYAQNYAGIIRQGLPCTDWLVNYTENSSHLMTKMIVKLVVLE